MTEPETPLEALKRLGAAKVRYLVATHGFSASFHKHAIDWLAQLDEAERERSEASQASQMRTAFSAKNAAWIAAIAAIIAAVLTIISVIIAILAWEYPKH
jgi:CHASE3 domain sensor protein